MVQADLAIAIVAMVVIMVALMGKAMVAELLPMVATSHLLHVLMVNVTCVVTMGTVHTIAIFATLVGMI